MSAAPAKKSAVDPTLKAVFATYTKDGTLMDSRTFVKLLKDTGIIDGKSYTTTSADLLFSKFKPKTERGITALQLQQALEAMAEQRKAPVEEIMAKVCSSEGPSLRGTVPDAVRFHDDKSLYTGTHAHGGPKVESGRASLDKLLDRTEADVRGVPKAKQQP